MTLDFQRKRLLELVAERDPPTDLKKASLACGKNHAYLHQFINRGTPRKLPEDVRHALAHHLGVDESALRPEHRPSPPVPARAAPPMPDTMTSPGVTGAMTGNMAGHNPMAEMIAVPEIRASSPAGSEAGGTLWYFDGGWLRHQLRAMPDDLRIVAIDGDSMEPVLHSGDRVMIDLGRTAPSPPGIFMLHDGIGLIARQVELIPNSHPARVLIRSESARYRNYERPLAEVNIIGRIIWFSRRL